MGRDGSERRRLLDAIPTETVRDLRDRALIGTLTDSLAQRCGTQNESGGSAPGRCPLADSSARERRQGTQDALPSRVVRNAARLRRGGRYRCGDRQSHLSGDRHHELSGELRHASPRKTSSTIGERTDHAGAGGEDRRWLPGRAEGTDVMVLGSKLIGIKTASGRVRRQQSEPRVPSTPSTTA
jgi:hypothetical protein